MEQYKATLTIESTSKKIKRTYTLPFMTSLYDLALNVYSSLIKEESDKYSFLFRFDDKVYISRKDEQESLYGYSDDSYHVLESETFFNVALSNPKKSTFEIIDYSKQDNLVLEMNLSDIKPMDEKEKFSLIDAEGILDKELKEKDCSFDEIIRIQKKSLPTIKKTYKYQRY